MPAYKYLRDDVINVRLVANEEKVKVREGEIVESLLPPNYFLGNGFAVVGIDPGSEKQEMTIGDIKKALTELKIEFPKNGKKVELEKILEEAVKAEADEKAKADAESGDKSGPSA